MTQDEILALIKREVVPAIGCTEPMCVALCVAHATEALGGRPESIHVSLSANVLKIVTMLRNTTIPTPSLMNISPPFKLNPSPDIQSPKIAERI